MGFEEAKWTSLGQGLLWKLRGSDDLLKKKTILLLLFALMLASPVWGGRLTIGANISLYDPPESGTSVSLMVGIRADYMINKHWSADAALEWTHYQDDRGLDYTVMPMTSNLRFHPLGQYLGKRHGEVHLDPYLGGGIGYYRRIVEGDDRSSFGYQALGGLRLHGVPGLRASFEVRYIVPDASHPERSGWSYGGTLGGGITIQI